MLYDVEPGPALGNGSHDGLRGLGIIPHFAGPELRVLQQARLDEPERAAEVAAEAPTRIAIHRDQIADFVVPETVDVKFADIVEGVIDKELTDVVIPQGEG